MANAIATVLANAKTINSENDAKGPLRHVYEELVALQTVPGDPALASPYLKASHVTTIPAYADTVSSGNFTITINFPNYGVAVTTGNIAFDANEATIQSAVDAALDTKTIVATYNAGDVSVNLVGDLTANAATLTANGTTVNGAYMVVTTTNVNLDADELVTPVVATAGTMNRPAEATLKLFDVVVPSGTLPYQGQAALETDYTLKDNPFSLSPATQKALIDEIIINENETIGLAIRSVVGCVGPNS